MNNYIESPETLCKPLVFHTLEELYALPEEQQSFVVDGLLPTKGWSLLAGKPKAGKSHLARQLATAVCKGERFLGRDTIQGQVLYLALEEKQTEVVKHFKAMQVPKGLHVLFDGLPKNRIEALDRAAANIDNLKLVIIDPLFQFIRIRDGNSYAEITSAMSPIMTLARKHDAHVLLVHHLKKGRTDDPRDATLGSTALNGIVDTILILEQKGESRVLSTAQFAADKA